MKLKKNKSKILLFLVLLSIISFQFVSVLIINRDRFFTRNYTPQFENLKKTYESSQYVKKNAPFIPDETFESYAGGAFLKGLNPILMVHDHPPLGRYFISLSILLFDNATTIIPIFLVLTFLGVFLIGKIILKDPIYSLIPIAILMNEPLTINKLMYTPLPEPIQLPFIVFSVYFFILAITSKKKLPFLLLVSLLIGVVISTRFFVTGGALTFTFLAFLLLFRKYRELFTLICVLPLGLLVLLASYTRTMQDGYTPFQILGVQKYILAYHKSAITQPFSFWDLILFNKWHTWWGKNEVLSDPQWIIFWPLSVISLWITVVFAFVKKSVPYGPLTLIIMWVVMYSAMLSMGYTSTRYFMPILPFLYIIFTYGLVYLVRYNSDAKKN